DYFCLILHNNAWIF
nr:immunoglobulin light chain junction region [Macaca mulatta]MOX81577.1 immunoglobulin light chain junction region [Macaca mulatta]MOX82233.1 immunoglobulin light chain junction region [Macaca mulatta]